MVSREDQIREEANKRYPLKWCDVAHCYYPQANSAFIEGALWADEYTANIWYDFMGRPPMEEVTDVNIPLLFHSNDCELLEDQYFIATLDEFLHYDIEVINSVCEWTYLPLAKRYEMDSVYSPNCSAETQTEDAVQQQETT